MHNTLTIPLVMSFDKSLFQGNGKNFKIHFLVLEERKPSNIFIATVSVTTGSNVLKEHILCKDRDGEKVTN